MCWAACAPRSPSFWRRPPAIPPAIAAVVIGTTHFTNAVIERRELQPVGALRICLPASASLPPLVDWPEDLAALVRGQVHMVAGGHEYDGRPIVPLDLGAIRDAGRRMADTGLNAVAVTSVFSPLTAECEKEAERILDRGNAGGQHTPCRTNPGAASACWSVRTSRC